MKICYNYCIIGDLKKSLFVEFYQKNMAVKNSEKISNAQIQSPKNLSNRRRQSSWSSRPSEDFSNRRKGAGIPKGASLDERLMNQPRTLNSNEEQNKVANELRQDKRGRNNKQENKQEKGTDRQIKAKSRREAKKKSKKGEKAGINPGNVAKQGTATLLRRAWLNLIDSFGLTLIYINLHVFGRSVLAGKVFCELGFEWLPPNMAKKIASSPEARSKMKTFGLIEKVVLIFVDLLVLFIIISSVSFLVLIIYILTNPVETGKVIGIGFLNWATFNYFNL